MALTPNADRARAEIRAFTEADPELSALLAASDHSKWPIGFFNCRKISGSSTWSQHSWGNALDVMKLNGTPNAQPGEPHYLDKIVAFVSSQDWGIKNALWRVRNHFNHAHFDWINAGTGRPPCDGGSLQTKNPAGGFVLWKDGSSPPPGGNEMFEVKELQIALNAAGAEPPLVEDGIYGDKTRQTLIRSLENSGEFAAGGGIGDHKHEVNLVGDTSPPI